MPQIEKMTKIRYYAHATDTIQQTTSTSNYPVP